MRLCLRSAENSPDLARNDARNAPLPRKLSDKVRVLKQQLAKSQQAHAVTETHLEKTRTALAESEDRAQRIRKKLRLERQKIRRVKAQLVTALQTATDLRRDTAQKSGDLAAAQRELAENISSMLQLRRLLNDEVLMAATTAEQLRAQQLLVRERLRASRQKVRALKKQLQAPSQRDLHIGSTRPGAVFSTCRMFARIMS